MPDLGVDLLSSMVEQSVHTLEEKGYDIRHLYPSLPDEETDPELEPGSAASMYSRLMSTLPKAALALDVFKSKDHAIREIAVDIGLANIAVAKTRAASDSSSIDFVRKSIDLDPSVELSEVAKHVLSKWGEVHQPTENGPVTTAKQKRVRLNEAQRSLNPMSQEGLPSSQTDGITEITMSQPVPGRYGTRTLRKKPRKSGF